MANKFVQYKAVKDCYLSGNVVTSVDLSTVSSSSTKAGLVKVGHDFSTDPNLSAKALKVESDLSGNIYVDKSSLTGEVTAVKFDKGQIQIDRKNDTTLCAYLSNAVDGTTLNVNESGKIGVILKDGEISANQYTVGQMLSILFSNQGYTLSGSWQ